MLKKNRKTLNILLVGSSGRMGREVETLIRHDKALTLAHKIDRSSGWPPTKVAHIVVDFSSPEGLRRAVQWALVHKVPLVSGTTGLTPADRLLLKKASRKIPILYSANMSTGIALFLKLLQVMKAVRAWDFEMEETHHLHKKDKPSGTALLLQAHLEKVLKRKVGPIVSHRVGDVPGTHSVQAKGDGESLKIEHAAYDRRIFARGALSAARWLFDKKSPGLYDLTDLYRL